MRVTIFLLAWIPLVVQLAQAGHWHKDLAPLYFNYDQPGRWARTLIHMHNVFSHDACDGKPQENGIPNAACRADLQNALCRNHVDIVFLTEHREHMALAPFNDVLQAQNLNRYYRENGQIVGGSYICNNGHTVHLYQGAENALMPIGLNRHPDALPGMGIEQTYNSRSPAAARLFREAGAIVGINHAEDDANTLELLREIQPEFIEAYNVHANLTYIYEGFNPFRLIYYLYRLLSFALNPLNETDLFFLGFLDDDEIALKKWAALATEFEITGVAGSDSHQNVAPINMADGERLDGYRRASRWFSNFLHVRDINDRADILQAVRTGRVLPVFEIFGTPTHFDFTARTKNRTYQMGETVEFDPQDPPILRVSVPQIAEAEVYTRILRATADGWLELEEEDGETLEFEVDQEGAYRVEVRVDPNHLNHLMPGKFFGYDDFPWIYSNPIYVREQAASIDF